MRIWLTLCILAIFAQVSFSQNYVALSGATIINTHDNSVIENGVVLLKDSVIVSAGAKIKGKLPENTKIVNVQGKYIIPGLVDGHIHFFQSGGLYTRPDGLDLRHRVPYQEHIDWIKANIDDVFRRYMRCGVTSVIDMGGPFWNFDVRDKSKTAAIAPRTYVAGPLIASYQPPQLTTDDLPIRRVETIGEALELVDKQVEMGTDFIKVWYVVSKGNAAGLNDFYPIYEKIVEKSHDNGLPVWVHATELETARKAVEGGCDVLAHIVTDKEVDEAFLKLCKERGVMVIPTLWVFSSYAAVYSKQLQLTKEELLWGNPKTVGTFFDMWELSYDELGERQRKLQIEKKPIVIDPILLKNLKKMHDYGITIAAGTDAGNVGVIHGASMFREIKLMTKAGLTPQEAISCATLNGAKLLGFEDKLGSIESGKLADLVVLNSNPLENIENLSDIELVVKNGEIFNADDIIENSPADLAQIQLNAYNNRNIDAFVEVYSPDVEVYMFPDSLRYKGRDKMREVYSKFFLTAPDLHCKLVDRISNNNFIVDREYVTGITGRDPINAVAIYEIKDGYIQKVWFLPK